MFLLLLFFFLFLHFPRTLKCQNGYVLIFFFPPSCIHKTNLWPSSGCPLGVKMFCHFALHSSPQVFLYETKRWPWEAFPFFEKMSAVFIPKMNWNNLKLLSAAVHFRNMTAETVLCLEAYCLYSVLVLRREDLLPWLLSSFVPIHSLMGTNSVLPLSYSSNTNNVG